MKNMRDLDMEHKVELFKRPEVKGRIVDYMMSLNPKNKAEETEKKESL